jgi:hypothetical protein
MKTLRRTAAAPFYFDKNSGEPYHDFANPKAFFGLVSL